MCELDYDLDVTPRLKVVVRCLRGCTLISLFWRSTMYVPHRYFSKRSVGPHEHRKVSFQGFVTKASLKYHMPYSSFSGSIRMPFSLFQALDKPGPSRKVDKPKLIVSLNNVMHFWIRRSQLISLQGSLSQNKRYRNDMCLKEIGLKTCARYLLLVLHLKLRTQFEGRGSIWCSLWFIISGL